MLTMKHIVRPKYGESAEYVRPIGSYVFKKKDDYVQFLAFDGLNENDTPSVWAGWTNGDKFENPVVGMIYIMNDAGATVANYRYISDGGPELWPELGVPPEAETDEPEKLAA